MWLIIKGKKSRAFGEICILIHNERSIRIDCRYKTDCISGESIERARIYGQELIYRLPTITQIYSLDIDWIGTINMEYTEYNTSPEIEVRYRK